MKKLCKDNKVVWNLGSAYRTTQVRSRSEVDTFYNEISVSSDDGYNCVHVNDPIIMLFNQERLAKLGDHAVESWLKSMEAIGNSQVAKLRSQCSDDDLLYMVKSRHLQAPCELTAWADYMAANMDKFKELMAAELADKKAKESAVVEPPKS